jgi:hypothetical protein
MASFTKAIPSRLAGAGPRALIPNSDSEVTGR